MAEGIVPPPRTSKNAELDDRLQQVERAIIQINHFTERIDALKLETWKSRVNTDIGWIKWLMGATTAAAIGQLVIGLVRGG